MIDRQKEMRKRLDAWDKYITIKYDKVSAELLKILMDHRHELIEQLNAVQLEEWNHG